LQGPAYAALYGHLGAAGPRFMNFGLAPATMGGAEPFQATLAEAVLRAGRDALGRDPALLVDVACGRGGALGLAAGMFPGAQLLGVDLQPEALRVARDSRVRVVAADGLRLPLREGVAEMAVSIEAMMNLGRGPFLAEAARVLSPGGVVAACGSFAGAPSQVIELIGHEANRAGLAVLRWRDLTEGVVAACEADAARRRALIAGAPRAIRPALEEFAALPGSATFTAYASGARCYYLAVFRRG
jgi:SAM-dependent methyltransferase